MYLHLRLRMSCIYAHIDGICESTGTNAYSYAFNRACAQTRDTADRSAINHGGLRYRLAGSTRRQTAAIWLTFLAALCTCGN